MSINLILVLLFLMLTNQIIGTSYGSWKNGFSKELLGKGLLKIFYLAIGYGALAFAAHFASEYVPAAEYISGILIEPIAKYFSKICESLRRLLSDSVSDIIKSGKEE
ncbi:MAG: hypothetical protein IJO74_00465 [Clostridia bacterium]|nr:hypothetical protein [Clostridia bacterium]